MFFRSFKIQMASESLRIWRRGSFCIRGYSSRLHTDSKSVEEIDDQAILISNRSDYVELSFPETCELRSQTGKLIWKPKKASLRPQLRWKSLPDLKIIFENKKELEINETPFQWQLATFGLLPFFLFIGIAAFHGLVFSLINLPKISLERAFDPKDLKDLQSLPVRVAESSVKKVTASAPNSTSLARRWSLPSSTKRPPKKSPVLSTSDIFRPTKATTKAAAKGWTLDGTSTEPFQNELNISANEVRELIQSAQHGLKTCYDEALIRDPHLRGEPQLQLHFNRQGGVSHVEILGFNAKQSSIALLESCFQETFTRKTLPQKPNQDFVVRYGLILSL